MTSSMERARAIADAVLYEGYLLYPYRASAAKNRARWQWGVLMPPSYGDEPSATHNEVLAEPDHDAVLHVRLRFLHLQTRTVYDRHGGAVPSLTVDGVEYTTWEEAAEREIDVALPFSRLVGADNRVPVEAPGGRDAVPIPGGEGARLVRTRHLLRAELLLRADPLPGPYGGFRLRLSVSNTSPWHTGGPRRDDALKHALIATHSLLSLSSGGFLSLLDPPGWAAGATRECRNEGAWPVLAGEPGRDDTVLCSPIILYDHPAVAAESPGELFDGTEIDEMLTLRTVTLTEEEKRQARATDARAAEIIDRAGHLPPDLLDRLHGAVRPFGDGPEAGRFVTDAPWWDPGADASVSPATDTVVVAGVPLSQGSRVRLRPGRHADAHDMFLAGRQAVVQAVLHDVDGNIHLAVSLGEDPLAAQGRFRYFAPDEVEPL
jgi:hypothetical protein